MGYAFDSIATTIGVEGKLRRLIKIMKSQSRVRVITRKEEMLEFIIKKRVQ